MGTFHQAILTIAQTLFTATAPVAVGGLAMALFRIAQHYKFQVTLSQEASWASTLQKGIAFAEELSAASVKAGKGALTPAQKLAQASDFVGKAIAGDHDIASQITAALPSKGWSKGATATPPAIPPTPAPAVGVKNA